MVNLKDIKKSIVNENILQRNILSSISFEDLPTTWKSMDTKSYSKNKNLYDFQENAIINILKCLFIFYKIYHQKKDEYYKQYLDNGIDQETQETLNISIKNLKEKIEISNYYHTEGTIIDFKHFVNRCAIWMATGSGKTIIIVKLLEIIKKLIDLEEIPNYDILLLTYREDLISQIKNHINEFNDYSIENKNFKINFVPLTEYEKIKTNRIVPFINELTVFYYRSDLINVERKKNIVDFKDFDNNGKWYVILDEAHKGSKEDLRQIFYSILARNGFLFNFSAVFVDPRDKVTTAFNFNLEKFVREGYGKHIYLSKQDLNAFKEKNDYNREEKQKVILKTLLLLAYIKKEYKVIKKIDSRLFHEPMLLALVNTVNLNKENIPDLVIFFREIERIGKGSFSKEALVKAKRELIEEFQEPMSFLYENVFPSIDLSKVSLITENDILKYIFNSESFGSIEVLTTPGDTKEAVLKLKTSETPFAVVKIGDIIKWVSENLQGYEISESYQDKTIFEEINQKDNISMLLGSRAFYEGWDSNRPNILLFINIGVGKDAIKYVIQSIGRGVRIEPIKNIRQRWNIIKNKFLFSHSIELPESYRLLEVLFVYGTNGNALGDIANKIKGESEESETIEISTINNTMELLVPVWKDLDQRLFESQDPQRFAIDPRVSRVLNNYFNSIDSRILYCKHNFSMKLLSFLKLNMQNSKYFKPSQNENIEVKNLDYTVSKLIKHFNLTTKDIDSFKQMSDEIVHFKNIKFFYNNIDSLNIFKDKIEKIKKSKDSNREITKIQDDFKNNLISLDEFTEKIRNTPKEGEEETFNELTIKNIANHYYFPVIMSERGRVNYINHIIDVESEVAFLKKLIHYCKDNVVTTHQWIFSKIDESVDTISIPYYDSVKNSMSNFKPDFIFWFKNGNRYRIVFVDPKGISHTQYQLKVEWFERFFGGNISPKEFNYKGLIVSVFLYMVTDDRNIPYGKYKDYWLDYESLSEIFDVTI